MRIGIIGYGIVGGATGKSLQLYHDIMAHDKNPTAVAPNNSIEEIVKFSEIIFVCVPTPMKEDGSVSTDIIESVVDSICRLSIKAKSYENGETVVVIRSTAVSGTTRKLINNYVQYRNHIKFAFNPEFLVEKTADNDARHPDRIIIGCGEMHVFEKLERMYRDAKFECPIVACSIEAAEMVKYASNCFLSTKVSFANELYQVCKAAKVDYNKVIEMLLYDKRIGKSHWSVPGPDGDYGFGGKCFPKDLCAFINLGKSLGVDMRICSASWQKNIDVRTDLDWTKIEGATVIKEESNV